MHWCVLKISIFGRKERFVYIEHVFTTSKQVENLNNLMLLYGKCIVVATVEALCSSYKQYFILPTQIHKHDLHRLNTLPYYECLYLYLVYCCTWVKSTFRMNGYSFMLLLNNIIYVYVSIRMEESIVIWFTSWYYL